MNRTNSVAQYIRQSAQWKDELVSLRAVLNATELQEEIKWGAPCYTYNGKNVVGIGAYKSYFGLWFHQGALLDDSNGVLINAQVGKTKAMRQWRMTAATHIKPAAIKRYVKESITHVDAGREIKADRNKPLDMPADLQRALRRQKGATAAFQAMPKGRRREYADYIANAKRDETKQRRIAKILPMIAAGSGLNDKYRRS